MARAEVKMPDDLLLKISNLGANTDKIVDEMLKAGSEIVRSKVKSCLEQVIGDTIYPSRSTGELVDSLGVSPPLLDKVGNKNVKIGFNEPRRNQNYAQGKRSYYERTNAMIANVLEYGKSGQAPKPFLKRAKNLSRNKSLEAMKAKFDEEVAKL